MAKKSKTLDEILAEFEEVAIDISRVQTAMDGLQLKHGRLCRQLYKAIQENNSHSENNDG